MMPPIITHILLFCLIPAGVFLLIKGIKFIRKSIGGAVALDMPLMQTEATFTIAKAGNYAIWQKGRTLGRMAINMLAPDISNIQTGEKLRIQLPVAVVNTNDGSNGKIRVFLFYALAGQYRYQLSADPAARDAWLASLRTIKTKDPTKFFIEVKESRPAGWLVLGILMVLLSAACIITGLVFTINPEAISG